MLRVLAHLLGQRLHELVERGAQLVRQLLDLFVGRAALQRLAQRVLRRRAARFSASETLPSSSVDRHRPQPRHHVAQLVVALGARELPVDRAQPEIDAGLRHEPLRRDRERIERAQHRGLGVGVEREIAALLDQRARQRLGERPLRQLESRSARCGPRCRPRRARSASSSTSAPAQGCSDRSLVVCADAGAGARLRQHQREVRRAVTADAAAWPSAACRAGLARERRLRVDHAVVVLDLVGEQQRAARLRLRLLGERDGRRAVRNGVEGPGHVVAARRARSRCRRR